jgi:PAS domain S-box-containing protein
MKKLSAFLNTPARVVIAVGLIILVSELLIMVLIETIHATVLQDPFVEKLAFEFLDPIALIAIVSPALYLLIFRPLNQQTELERQLDELRSFQRLSIGRELRIKELVEEIAALRNPLSAAPAGAIPVTSGSLEKLRHEAGQHATTQTMEDSQRSALLFMLEDLEAARKKIEHSHREWISALDVVNDPIFLHDEQFRILRCNKAYQQRAGIPFHELVGQLYYEVFPKNHEPLPSCLRVMENAVAEEEEEEVLAGDAIYRSRAFSIHDAQGAYLHSVHILEDITKHKRAESKLVEQIEELRRWHDVTSGREERILDLKHEINELLGSVGQPPRYPSAESDDPQEK